MVSERNGATSAKGSRSLEPPASDHRPDNYDRQHDDRSRGKLMHGLRQALAPQPVSQAQPDQNGHAYSDGHMPIMLSHCSILHGLTMSAIGRLPSDRFSAR